LVATSKARASPSKRFRSSNRRDLAGATQEISLAKIAPLIPVDLSTLIRAQRFALLEIQYLVREFSAGSHFF